jgi:hypothetical protein
MKAWKYLYDKAHSLGMEAGIWIAPHLAHNSPALKEHSDWIVRGFDTTWQGGGYNNESLNSVNMNTGVRAWMVEDLRRWKEEGGLDFVWIDSLGNLGLLPVDYSRELESSAFAIAEFVADLQRMGIENIELEGSGPFGVNAAYLGDINPLVTSRYCLPSRIPNGSFQVSANVSGLRPGSQLRRILRAGN